VEHSGLGRYGDALNPWGDIIAVAKAWCVTKVNGSLTLAVMFNENKDYIRFNADRFYGKVRYPYLTSTASNNPIVLSSTRSLKSVGLIVYILGFSEIIS
jgi:hypothetical protein